MLEQVTLEMVDIKQVYQLLEFRTVIETEAAALAAERHQQKDIEELEEALYILEQNMLDDGSNIGDDADYHFS